MIMELVQTDLPEPVAPAIIIWGSRAMSPMTALPAISRPTANASLLLELRKLSLSRISRRETVSLWLLGTSMPIAGFPGMGASMRTPCAASDRAMSSASPVILETLMPAAGCISYRVTEGPRKIPVMRTVTPKLFSVSTRMPAFSFIS